MSILASALLKLSPAVLGKRLKTGIDFPDGTKASVVSLDDGVILKTALPFGAEPDELGAALGGALGETGKAHADTRGVLVYPAQAKVSAKTYDAAVAEIGELGFWVSLDAEPPAQDAGDAMGGLPFDADMMAQLGGLMAAMPPDAMEQMQAALASGDHAALARIQSQIESAVGGADGLARLQEQVAGMLQGMDPGLLEQLQGQMMGQGAGGDPDEALRNARAQLEELRKVDPAAAEEFERRFGGALPKSK